MYEPCGSIGELRCVREPIRTEPVPQRSACRTKGNSACYASEPDPEVCGWCVQLYSLMVYMCV